MRWIFICAVPFTMMLHGFSVQPVAVQECPCCGPEYRQFDFWEGEWIVYDSLESEVGRNSIVAAQEGCLLVESWTSSSGGTGTSYNYYNRIDSTWEPEGHQVIQTWETLDASNRVRSLLFKGYYRREGP
jgi:hypothetical protein